MEDKQQSKTIGGIKFKTAPFMALQAVKLQRRLLKLFAPSVGKLIGGLDVKTGQDIGDASFDASKITEAIADLFDKLDEKTFIGLIEILLSNTMAEIEKDGKRIVAFNNGFEAAFNIVFDGNTENVYPVLFFVLEVNFPNFFDRIKGFGGNFQTLVSKVVTGEEKNE